MLIGVVAAGKPDHLIERDVGREIALARVFQMIGSVQIGLGLAGNGTAY
jgi:hypothetical protein